MPRTKDPLRSFRLPGERPLRSKKGMKRGSETHREFVERAVREAPDIYRAVEGDDMMVAKYFDMPMTFVLDLADQYGDVREARGESRAIAKAKKRDGVEVGRILQEKAQERAERVSARPKRKRWPKDPDDRHAALRKWLIDKNALVLYEGNLIPLAEATGLHVSELMQVIDGDEELEYLRGMGMKVAAEYAVDRLMTLSRESNTPASIKYFLANVTDKWKDRQSVEVDVPTFEAPPDAAEMASVISIVKDEKDGDSKQDAH